ncbi:MAG TPA: diguanylate cyclase [Rectinemataceae bacterium]|nr:diguanylate cyclase [Rectinemataceae bacterium]
MTTKNKRPDVWRGLDYVSGAIALCAAVVGSFGLAIGGVGGAIVAATLAGVASALLVPALGAKAPAAAPQAEASKPTIEPSPSIPEDRTDELTGLANENGLKAWFAEHTPRLVEEKLSIVVLSASLEGFDAIVRGRGKVVADKVLIEVAHRIAVFAGEEGIAARTGGGEFASKVAVVPEHSVERASEIAAKMAEVLQRPVELPEGVIWIGACVGAASGPATEGLGVLDRARAALAKAKQVGLGHYVVDKG